MHLFSEPYVEGLFESPPVDTLLRGWPRRDSNLRGRPSRGCFSVLAHGRGILGQLSPALLEIGPAIQSFSATRFEGVLREPPQ